MFSLPAELIFNIYTILCTSVTLLLTKALDEILSKACSFVYLNESTAK
jgi:hypothetical protein